MTQTPLTISQLPDLGSVQGSDRLVLDRVGAAVTAGAFVVGQTYQIISVGNTSFTAIGAESNTVGAYFVATGAGTGTGTAGPIDTGDAPLSAVAALLGGDPAGTSAAAIVAHVAAADPHPGYTTPQEAAAAAPVQSVALSVPSGWSTSSTNTDGGVTLTLALPTGFSLPSNATQATWTTGAALAGTAVQPAELASTLSGYLTTANGALTYQPLDGDLTAIAGLSTTAYGRSALVLANAAAGRTWLELGTAATAAAGDFATPASLSTGLATKADLVGGVVPSSQIPAIALVQYLGQVSSQTAMLALRGQGGDWCIRTDGGASKWVIVANDGSSLADWVQMPTGTAGVSSINGQTGAVTLGTGDLTETGGNQFFTAARAIGSALTGFVAEAGTVAATDSILQAINKIVGNIAGRALAGAIGSSGLTMTAGVLGRESGTGAPQVYPLGSGLSIVAGAITATATSSSSDYLAILASSEVAVTTTATATISRQHLISGTTADYTVTLPAAAGNAGKFISFRISDAATRRFTISGNASELINGQNTRIMWAGESAVLYCDGSGWLKLFGVTKPMQCQISLTSTQTISNLTMTDVTFSRVDVDNTGAMADTANSRIINFRPGQYILMAHLMWDNTTGSATRLIGQIFNSNTSLAITAHEMTAFAHSCYPSCQPYALVALLATSTIKLQAYKSANVTNVYGHPTTDTTQLMAIEVPSW
jgi:hypothetical protein